MAWQIVNKFFQYDEFKQIVEIHEPYKIEKKFGGYSQQISPRTAAEGEFISGQFRYRACLEPVWALILKSNLKFMWQRDDVM